MKKGEINHQQNLEIQRLDITLKNLIVRFDKFIENDFNHLRNLVYWLIGLAITGLLVPIFLKLYF